MNLAIKDVHKFMEDHQYKFANMSTALFSINNILYTRGYHLANYDGTPHHHIYNSAKGDALINIVDSEDNLLSSKIFFEWELLSDGLGWMINVKLV